MSGMNLPRLAVVSILAASLCAYATAAELIAGPWVVLTPDGGARIGAEWSIAVDLPGRVDVRLGERVVGLPADQRPFLRDGVVGSSVTDVVVAPSAYHSGPFLWEVAGRTLSGSLPALPAPDAPVRIAVIGAQNYPDGPALERLATLLGGPLDAVVLAGAGRHRALGRGGWEHATPLILLCEGGADASLNEIAPASRWQHGVMLGCLGLSCAKREADWPAAISSQFCAWRIPVMAEPQWDPGLLAPADRREPDPMRSLVDLASGLEVPAILQMGGRAGFISEPLLSKAGVLRSLAGGVRVLGATPAGEGLSGLAEAIATPLPGIAVVGLRADSRNLLLVVSGSEPAVELAWGREASGVLNGPGTGSGDAKAAWDAWRKGDETQLASAAWAAIPGLQRIALTKEDADALVAGANSGTARLAARRYLGRPDGGIMPELAPEWLVRERALRELGRNAVVPGSTAAIILISGVDDEVLHAAVRCLQGPQRGLLLDLLSERLRRYGKTGAPDILDPLVRHRVMAAVFGAPDRSPTGLRPIALLLRDRLNAEAAVRELQWGRDASKVEKRDRLDKEALIRGPVERFLARHGEIRK